MILDCDKCGRGVIDTKKTSPQEARDKGVYVGYKDGNLIPDIICPRCLKELDIKLDVIIPL